MKLKIIILSILSPVVLFFSFPIFDFELFAWFGFIPLFFAILNMTKRQAFWLSYLSGFIFFVATLYWLIHVTLPGLIILCLYLAFYFAFFGYFFNGIRRKFPKPSLVVIIFLSSIWVILEYIRSQIMSGFPWALLGYSQYLNTKIIQFVDIVGSYGLSFLVIFVNLCIFEMLNLLLQKKFRLFVKFLLILFLISSIIYSYGIYSIAKYSSGSKDALRVSLIQGNILQEDKWASIFIKKIKDIYFDLSLQSLKDSPDIIIWPETSYPDYVISGNKESTRPIMEFFDVVKKPILFGAVYQQKNRYFNAAILLSDSQAPLEIYKKIHLVPFGEYLPLRKYLSFLEELIPIEDFSEGNEFTVFKTINKQGEPVRFGVLICFEDTMLELSRQFRLKGADFLVNITNDAWFKQSPSPYQHLQASVLRAVENRVYMLRAANTGVTSIIDNCGRIVRMVKDSNGQDVFTRGFISGEVKKQNIVSPYTKFGDVVVLFSFLYTAAFSLYVLKRRALF